jgi:hypothetical protein
MSTTSQPTDATTTTTIHIYNELWLSQIEQKLDLILQRMMVKS